LDIHSLRHTAATRLARSGCPMAVLQRFMGHADPRTTQRYYDHMEVEDLAGALDLVPDVLPGGGSGERRAGAP
jgi:integrase